MPIFPLDEVAKFDNGDNTPESFFVGPLHHPMQDFVRLVCDLLLVTRENHGPGEKVVFSDLPSLVEEAATRMSRRIDEITSAAGVVESPMGLMWVPWQERPEGARRPTPAEVSDFEGESRLLYDSASDLEAKPARRLFAAWGVYCCERAMRAMKARDQTSSVAVLVASAGALLGHANWCDAWHTKTDLIREERRRGAFGRLAKDKNAAAKVRAKSAATALWPEANRKGWTASRLHTELVNRGHTIKSDTVRKWLTSLRKTGAC
jgi:hypothetical protein